MLKLVISDFDGTFLNSNGQFDLPYYNHVKRLMDQKGIIFAACTGKQCERVEELFGKENAADIWILGDSATRIRHKGKYVYESLLPNKIGLDVIQTLETISPNDVVIACTPTAAFIKNTLPEEKRRKVRGSYAVVKEIADLQSISEDFVKITVFDSTENCFETVKGLKKHEKDAYIVASEAAWIDISNVDVHKGTTVKKLQKMLNIKKSETIAFGDGYNDLELFKESGVSFAMKNAFDEVKESADFITKSNDENGVLTTIEKLIDLID